LSIYLAIAILAADPIINLAIWLGIIVFILNILLSGLILGQRYLYLLDRRQEKIATACWLPIIIASLAEIPPHLPPILPRERLVALTLWNQIHQTVKGSVRDNLHRLAYSLGIQQIARRFLESRQISEQLVGIATLGNLKEVSAWEKLFKLAIEQNPYVSVAAAQALVKINVAASCELVSNSICDRLDWSLALVVEILSVEENDLLVSKLIETIPKLPPQSLFRVFRVLEVSHNHALATIIPDLLETFASYDEIIGAGLRILAGYKNPYHLQIMRRYLHHSDWLVRVQAANGLSQMGTVEDEESLIVLLADPEWWVRYRAAQALANLPLMSLTHLEKIEMQLSDRFARDILTQVIAEIKLTREIT
jgi:hypothetical protein